MALPIWLDFMREAEKGRPIRDFPTPPGVVLARANPETGEPAPPTNPKSRLMPFKRGTLPPIFRGSSAGFSDACVLVTVNNLDAANNGFRRDPQ